LKAADKVNMTPEQVAKIAVDSLFQKKTEVITGALNKAVGFFTWLLPKKFIEGTAAKLYE
jgi:short-subunit dehydrogenase